MLLFLKKTVKSSAIKNFRDNFPEKSPITVIYMKNPKRISIMTMLYL